MSMLITDDCINCGACIFECPNHAIYEAGENWDFSVDTFDDSIRLKHHEDQSSKQEFQPLNDDFYFIVPEKCTECYSISKEPQCLTICPIDCIENFKIETEDELEQKINFLHGNKRVDYLKFNENRTRASNNYSVSEEFDDENHKGDKSNDNFLIKVLRFLS